MAGAPLGGAATFVFGAHFIEGDRGILLTLLGMATSVAEGEIRAVPAFTGWLSHETAIDLRDMLNEAIMAKRTRSADADAAN